MGCWWNYTAAALLPCCLFAGGEWLSVWLRSRMHVECQAPGSRAHTSKRASKQMILYGSLKRSRGMLSSRCSGYPRMRLGRPIVNMSVHNLHFKRRCTALREAAPEVGGAISFAPPTSDLKYALAARPSLQVSNHSVVCGRKLGKDHKTSVSSPKLPAG